MGLIERLLNKRIHIDTAPIIYFIEKRQTYLDLIRPLFVEIESGNIQAITSERPRFKESI